MLAIAAWLVRIHDALPGPRQQAFRTALYLTMLAAVFGERRGAHHDFAAFLRTHSDSPSLWALADAIEEEWYAPLPRMLGLGKSPQPETGRPGLAPRTRDNQDDTTGRR